MREGRPEASADGEDRFEDPPDVGGAHDLQFDLVRKPVEILAQGDNPAADAREFRRHLERRNYHGSERNLAPIV